MAEVMIEGEPTPQSVCYCPRCGQLGWLRPERSDSRGYRWPAAIAHTGGPQRHRQDSVLIWVPDEVCILGYKWGVR